MSRIIIELNEFNEEALRAAAKSRPNLQKLIDQGMIQFTISENYESDFLEPWSQWVTVHTGLACSEHQIKHLGDIHDLTENHIWDEYPEKFGTIWGCLNSKNPNSEKIQYFPDPWTLKSSTNINHRRALLSFLRFSVGTRTYPTKMVMISSYLKILPDIALAGLQLSRGIDIKFISIFLKYFKKVKFNSSFIYALVEYLAFKAFLRDRIKSDKTDVVFLNMLAHSQHYYWHTDNHKMLELCYDFTEAIIEKIHSTNNEITLFNGLGQEYSGDLEQWHSWVPIGGWKHLIKDVLHIDARVEPCMSYDCNLFFKSQEDSDMALGILSNLKSPDGSKLLLIEENEVDQKKVFIRLNYFSDGTGQFVAGNSKLDFTSVFELTAIRSGRHCQISTAFGFIPKTYDNKKTDLNNQNAYHLYE